MSSEEKMHVKLHQTILNQKIADMFVFLFHQSRAEAWALSHLSVQLHPQIEQMVTRDTHDIVKNVWYHEKYILKQWDCHVRFFCLHYFMLPSLSSKTPAYVVDSLLRWYSGALSIQSHVEALTIPPSGLPVSHLSSIIGNLPPTVNTLLHVIETVIAATGTMMTVIRMM